MEIMARENQEIWTGQIIVSKSYRRRPTLKSVATGIVWSKMEDPTIKNHCEILGKVNTVFDESDDVSVESILEFHFYDTIIKAVVYKENKPEDKKVHYITNYK